MDKGTTQSLFECAQHVGLSFSGHFEENLPVSIFHHTKSQQKRAFAHRKALEAPFAVCSDSDIQCVLDQMDWFWGQFRPTGSISELEKAIGARSRCQNLAPKSPKFKFKFGGGMMLFNSWASKKHKPGSRIYMPAKAV